MESEGKEKISARIEPAADLCPSFSSPETLLLCKHPFPRQEKSLAGVAPGGSTLSQASSHPTSMELTHRIEALRQEFLDAALALIAAERTLDPGINQSESIRRLPDGCFLCGQVFLARLDDPMAG